MRKKKNKTVYGFTWYQVSLMNGQLLSKALAFIIELFKYICVSTRKNWDFSCLLRGKNVPDLEHVFFSSCFHFKIKSILYLQRTSSQKLQYRSYLMRQNIPLVPREICPSFSKVIIENRSCLEKKCNSASSWPLRDKLQILLVAVSTSLGTCLFGGSEPA